MQKEHDMGTIFVSALPFKASEETLRNAFETFGPESVEIFADWAEPTYEPYALMDLKEPDAAVKAMDGKQIGHKHLRVHRKEKVK